MIEVLSNEDINLNVNTPTNCCESGIVNCSLVTVGRGSVEPICVCALTRAYFCAGSFLAHSCYSVVSVVVVVDPGGRGCM